MEKKVNIINSLHALIDGGIKEDSKFIDSIIVDLETKVDANFIKQENRFMKKVSDPEENKEDVVLNELDITSKIIDRHKKQLAEGSWHIKRTVTAKLYYGPVVTSPTRLANHNLFEYYTKENKRNFIFKLCSLSWGYLVPENVKANTENGDKKIIKSIVESEYYALVIECLGTVQFLKYLKNFNIEAPKAKTIINEGLDYGEKVNEVPKDLPDSKEPLKINFKLEIEESILTRAPIPKSIVDFYYRNGQPLFDRIFADNVIEVPAYTDVTDRVLQMCEENNIPFPDFTPYQNGFYEGYASSFVPHIDTPDSRKEFIMKEIVKTVTGFPTRIRHKKGENPILSFDPIDFHRYGVKVGRIFKAWVFVFETPSYFESDFNKLGNVSSQSKSKTTESLIEQPAPAPQSKVNPKKNGGLMTSFREAFINPEVADQLLPILQSDEINWLTSRGIWKSKATELAILIFNLAESEFLSEKFIKLPNTEKSKLISIYFNYDLTSTYLGRVLNLGKDAKENRSKPSEWDENVIRKCKLIMNKLSI